MNASSSTFTTPYRYMEDNARGIYGPLYMYVYIRNYFTRARGHHLLISMAINTNAPNTASEIQSGEKIHHQLHVDTIPTSASLSVKKMRNSMVPTPMLFDLLLSFICLFIFIILPQQHILMLSMTIILLLLWLHIPSYILIS